MSIESCIARLANAGKLTKQQADDARALYNRILNEDLFRNMDKPAAEAAASVELAKRLEAQAKAKKMELARRVNHWIANSERIDAHPNGPIAGFMALYDRDTRNAAMANRENVSSLERELYQPTIAAKVHEADAAYRSTMAGLKQDKTGVRNMVREIFGESTGDTVAAHAAKGWKDATEWATQKAKDLGKIFEVAEDWRLPQFWESKRVNKFGEGEFKADLQRHIDSGALKVFDQDTGKFVAGAERDKVLQRASDDIRKDMSSRAGPSTVFKNEQRTFRFAEGRKGADAYLELMDKYGPGQGHYYPMLQSHGEKMARELAMLHVMGPNFRTAGDALLKSAIEKDATRALNPPARTAWEKLGDTLMSPLEGRANAERLHKLMTGQTSGVESEAIAGVFQGARAWLTASNMGGAIVTAIPSDAVNWAMAAKFRGLDAGRLAKAIFDQLASDAPDKEAFATRLGVTAHAATRIALGTKQYGDQMFGTGVFQRMADFVVRAQGLHAWDSAINRAFSMEFLASIAERAGKGFDDLDHDFARFLTDYGFTKEDWAKLAKGETMSAGAAKFLMPDSLEEGVRAKLMSAIGDEKQFAYLAGSSNRIRALTSGGTKGGTLPGELTRSMFLFKSFPIMMLATHGVRAAQEASNGRWGQAAALGTFMTLAGAVAIQAKQVLQGKNPKPVDEGWFWGEAALMGGALGPYGDLLKGATEPGKASWTDMLMGPMAEFPEALQDITSSTRRAAESGEKVNYGRMLARDIQKFAPGGTLWYTRLLANRYLFDNIQKSVDPDYARAFARAKENAEKLHHQTYWWAPGDNAPSARPDLSQMVR
jgi:hypothetical protein